ncbi:MAG: sterol homeostasis protein [Chrysothrix sp. TS-e1954]|nr:MAG: sterol homeostasis protein [Chrysothrix sp. TS-e1954]
MRQYNLGHVFVAITYIYPRKDTMRLATAEHKSNATRYSSLDVPEHGPRATSELQKSPAVFSPSHVRHSFRITATSSKDDMPICIECRFPVHQLYTSYSKADDRSLGKGVRLTQCPRCRRFADKYVEHDLVVLFIDLVLIKPQVYRHVLFNRLGTEDDKFDPSIIRLGVLCLLFDVYLTWARIEKAYPRHPPGTFLSPEAIASSTHSIGATVSPTAGAGTNPATAAAASPSPAPDLIANQPIILQYIFFLAFCTLCTLAFHLPIRLLTSLKPPFSLLPETTLYPNRVSTALLVSSCIKLLPILMVIWDYDLPSSASAVSWAVLINNVAALEILLDCGYVRSAVIVGIGAIVRGVVGWWVMREAGIGGGGGGAVKGVLETGDLMGALGSFGFV